MGAAVATHTDTQRTSCLPLSLPLTLCGCAGFFLSYNASNLRPNITDAVASMLTVHPDAPIYVLGHSMGAAVATLCALDLLFTFQLDSSRVRLYTYGSPRVGNEAFAAYVKTKLPVRGFACWLQWEWSPYLPVVLCGCKSAVGHLLTTGNPCYWCVM